MTLFERKTVSILSIDWDWFFPDVDDYDWTHNEEGPVYHEMIWMFRPGNTHLTDSSKVAVHTVRPDRERLDGFWERTVRMMPWGLCIAETHSDLYRVIKESIQPRGVRIVNYDAHHDAGYGLSADLNCGNWAQKLREDGLLKDYQVVYPPWRKENPEGRPKGFKGFRSTRIPAPLQRYDFVFVCRSGCWTPPWADREWLEFVGWWQREKWVWDHKTVAPYAMKERYPDHKEALELAKQAKRQYEKLMKKAAARR